MKSFHERSELAFIDALRKTKEPRGMGMPLRTGCFHLGPKLLNRGIVHTGSYTQLIVNKGHLTM